MTDVEYRVAAGLVAFIAGLVVWQQSRIRSLSNKLLQEQYEKDKLSIEKSIANLSDADLRKQLDDFIKKPSG